MNEKAIGKALLNLDNPTPLALSEGKWITRQVIERDRWRIRLWTGLSTFFWLLPFAGVVWLITVYSMYVVPRLNAYAAGRAHLQNDWTDWVTAFNFGANVLLASIVGLLIAALSLVMLVITSRQAILRQINANLADISDQLKLLQKQP